MKIFLVRHGMSQSNEDWSANTRVADHAIELTEEGKKQAASAGEFSADYFDTHLAYHAPSALHKWNPTEVVIPKIRLWNSPYARTRQTRDALMSTCVLPDLNKRYRDAGAKELWGHPGWDFRYTEQRTITTSR
jgi:2,3-bisphosphoglycerate-dependent phosphoglycerate mutase